MAVACASRFSVLKLEDDDMSETVNKKTNAQNNKQAGKNSKQSIKTATNDSKSKSKKKKKTATEIAEVIHYFYLIPYYRIIFYSNRISQLIALNMYIYCNILFINLLLVTFNINSKSSVLLKLNFLKW